MAKVVWTDTAVLDLKNIIDYIYKDSIAYAKSLGKQLVRAPRSLNKFPFCGRIVPEFRHPDIRELIYGSYRIIYIVKKDVCYITAIIHSSRDFMKHIEPGQWDFTK